MRRTPPSSNPNMMRVLAEYQHTRRVPQVFRMGADPTIPDVDVRWTHADDRASSTGKSSFFEIAAGANGKFDLTTDDGRADFRAFLMGTLETITQAGGFYIPGDPPVPAMNRSNPQLEIMELTPLVPSQTLPPAEQLEYETARVTLLTSIVLYAQRFAVLAGDPYWKDPPQRSKDFCPIYTRNGDPKGYTSAPFSLPTTPPIEVPKGADPDYVPPPVINMTGAESEVRIGLDWVIVGVGALLVIVGYAVYKMTQASSAAEANRKDSFDGMKNFSENGMTKTGDAISKLLNDHIAEDRKNGKVTPLTPAEKTLIGSLQDEQKIYAAQTAALAKGVMPPKPIGQAAVEQIGGILGTALWIGAFFFAGKFLLNTVLAKRPTLTNRELLAPQALKELPAGLPDSLEPQHG